MLENINLTDLLFIDIETVPREKTLYAIPEYEQMLWEEKMGRKREDDKTPEDFYFENAGILAEFGKIVCISVGHIPKDQPRMLKVKSFYGNDERQILKEFRETLAAFTERCKNPIVCGHNIKEFDIPYLCRKYLMQQEELPPYLSAMQSKKPWETTLLDTMELWKFGDYKNYISLKLLAYSLGIPSPKDDIDGKMVGYTYWHEGDIKRIKTYCQKDIITVAQILLRMKEQPLITEQEIEYLT